MIDACHGVPGSTRPPNEDTLFNLIHRIWRPHGTRQGRHLTDHEVRKIAQLLSSTDTNLREIATRMNCSHSAVVAINRRLNIREYAGRKSSWKLAS